MRQLLLAAALAAVFLGGTAPSADAAFKIRAKLDAGAFVTATDQVFVGGVGTVADLNTAAGVIVAQFTFPGVTFLVTVGSSKPAVGSANVASFDISVDGSFSAAGAGGTITVEMTDTGFGSGFGPSGPVVMTSELGGAGFGDLTSFSFQAWLDNANAEFGIPGTFTTGLQTAPGVVSAGGTADTSYSLTSRTIITAGPGADFSFDNNVAVTAIPAPPALLLAMTALPAVLLLRRPRAA